jgi:hypothetical protein
LNRWAKKAGLRIALVTAMALLIAQFAAQAHAYSHLHPGSDSTEQLDSHGRLCSECLSFAPLLATAGGLAHVSFVRPDGVAPAPDVSVLSLISRSPTAAFRSRAPPRNS